MTSLSPVLLLLVSLFVLCTGLGLWGKSNTVTLAEAQQGWILLFDGRSLFGWSPSAGSGWTVSGEALISNGATSSLRSESPFGDFELRLEYLLAAQQDQASLVIRASKDPENQGGYRIPLGSNDSGMHPTPNQWRSLTVTAKDNEIRVAIDNTEVSDEKDASIHAGFIVLNSSQGARVSVRRMELKPIFTTPLFDGTDLTGWKATGVPPSQPKQAGLIKKIPHLFEPKSKPKDPKWSVQGGAIHGEGGTGQLESTQTFDNFILQIAAQASSSRKPRLAKASVYLRADPGKTFSGYELPLTGENKGSISKLAEPRRADVPSETILETIVLYERHFQIWLNGYPATDFVDTRPEGSTAALAAKISAGPVALSTPSSEDVVNYQNLNLASIPKFLGETAAKSVPSSSPAPVASPAVQGSPAIAVTPPIPPVTPAVPGLSAEEVNRQKTAPLMSQALRSKDAEEQMRLFDEVVRLDPSTSAAQGYKDAQGQVQARRAVEQKQENQQIQHLEQKYRNEAERDSAIQRAQEAFIRGDLGAAQRSIAIAQRLAPSNSTVNFLAQRLAAAQRVRSQWILVSSGAGLFVLVGGFASFLRRRGDQQARLQVLSGKMAGKKFDLNKDKVSIGAVEKDGSYHNDIVLADSHGKVSRFHCEIHRREKNYFLIDCRSSNGTWLDHKPVPPGKPVRLKRGSRIELGRQVVLRFDWERPSKAHGSEG